MMKLSERILMFVDDASSRGDYHDAVLAGRWAEDAALLEAEVERRARAMARARGVLDESTFAPCSAGELAVAVRAALAAADEEETP